MSNVVLVFEMVKLVLIRVRYWKLMKVYSKYYVFLWYDIYWMMIIGFFIKY